VIIAWSISPLTLPKEPGDTDDCLLTASEVMQLKLNADWEVLSACNTIAGDNSGRKRSVASPAPSSMPVPARC
jgi:hypothetical protein